MSTPPEKIGRYQVIRLLGQGAMGAVYLGRDPSLDREVAIKTIKELDLPEDTKKRFLERFRNEAKAAARLHDPTIVQVFDVGEDASVGGPFLVLEYVKGTTLKHVLRERGPLAPEDLVDVARQVAHAIDLAHERGIIHRDVKPDNILFAEDGRAKLADFGVARLPDAALTKEGQFLGTPCYAAPETLTAGKYGPRTDLFSFAAVLYELASGARAFPGDDAISVAHAVIHDDPPPPSTAGNVKIPAQVDAAIMRGLDKRSEARFASAMELAEAVEQAYVDAGLLAPVTGERTTQTRPTSEGPGGAFFAGLLLVILVVAIGGVLWLGDFSLFGPAVDVADGALPDATSTSADAGARARPRDAGDEIDSATPLDDAGSDAWSDPDTGSAAPTLSRQEREDMAKDELDAARASVERHALDEARQHLARARELDPESSDLEEIEALIAAEAP
ncbi:MAG: serine/threonine-protein kinase [Sandaracinus sp.]